MDRGVGLLVPRQANAGERTVRSTRRQRIAGVFPPDRPGLGLRWYWALLAVALGALVSLGRVPGGPGVLNTLWAEDGSDFLGGALNDGPYRAILRPLNGYLVVVPRLLAVPASLVPIGWGPAVLTVEAALVTGAMAVAVYAASRTHLRYRLARLIAAVPVLAVPVGENLAAATANNVATLQFSAVYCALWMVLWVPQRRGTRIAAAAVVVAVALSTFLAAVLIPLAALRLYTRRDVSSGGMLGGLLAALAANIALLATHVTARPQITPPRYDLGWAFSQVSNWALPHALFGYGFTGGAGQLVHPSWLVVAAWPLIAAAVLVAALRLTRPQWKLAGILFVSAVLLVLGPIMQYGGTELRYVVAPELMVFAALAALLLPRQDHAGWTTWAPLMVLAVCVAVVLAVSYRTAGPRASLAPWKSTVDRARTACLDANTGAVYTFPADGTVVSVPNSFGPSDGPPADMSPFGFPMRIPCSRLR